MTGINPLVTFLKPYSLSWSFVRDRGLPFSRQLERIHPTLRVPVIPLVISFLGVFILGALYVGSTTVNEPE